MEPFIYGDLITDYSKTIYIYLGTTTQGPTGTSSSTHKRMKIYCLSSEAGRWNGNFYYPFVEHHDKYLLFAG